MSQFGTWSSRVGAEVGVAEIYMYLKNKWENNFQIEKNWNIVFEDYYRERGVVAGLPWDTKVRQNKGEEVTRDVLS